jgi:hypothetical protein
LYGYTAIETLTHRLVKIIKYKGVEMVSKRKRFIYSILALVFVGLACGIPTTTSEPTATTGPNLEATLLAITVQAIEALQTEQAAPQAAVTTAVQAPADAQAPTNTPIPAAQAAASTPGKPTLSVSVNTNCRSGPGLKYTITGSIAVGGSSEVVAKAPSPEPYVIIKNPGGGADCWAWLQHATITGDISSLPVLPVPKPPVGSLSGMVWLEDCDDTNPGPTCIADGNGFHEGDGKFSGELGISGVSLQVFSGKCPPTTSMASATTDGSGKFRFDGLEAGTYCIKTDDSFLSTSGLGFGGKFTFPSRGTSVQTTQVDLLPAENKSGINFGWDDFEQ